jgi:predicted patatin/cPLA2 family phospholipase
MISTTGSTRQPTTQRRKNVAFTAELRLVERIRNKQSMLLVRDENHRAIRLALVGCGGNLAGSFGGGVMVGFERLGLANVFDYVIGVSAGSANLAYLLSQQAVLGSSIYYQDLIDRRFINPWRLRKLVDIDYLEDIIRNKKPLNTDAIRQSRSEFFVTATTINGECQLLDAKACDIVSALKASMAIPMLYNRPVELGGCHYLDGAASSCLPIRETLGRFDPTDVLVILNRPIHDELVGVRIIERLLAMIYLRRFSDKLRRGFLERHLTMTAALDFIKSGCGVNIAIISPDYPISNHDQNPQTLRQFVFHGATKVWQMFGQVGLSHADVLL